MKLLIAFIYHEVFCHCEIFPNSYEKGVVKTLLGHVVLTNFYEKHANLKTLKSFTWVYIIFAIASIWQVIISPQFMH